MEKKYSFDEDKVIDAEVSEVGTSDKEEKKGFSWKKNLKKQGSAFGKGLKKVASSGAAAYKEYNKPENVLKRKKLQADKTKFDAQIAKNKSQINKYSETNTSDFGLGFGSSSSSEKKKKKKGSGGIFDDGFF